jgi:hypothetical protein
MISISYELIEGFGTCDFGRFHFLISFLIKLVFIIFLAQIAEIEPNHTPMIAPKMTSIKK